MRDQPGLKKRALQLMMDKEVWGSFVQWGGQVRKHSKAM
eukprot:CAMPEP_0171083970 /NCGR_PEP_ID=MMETSP0766_2-20121228/18033_1 /TAXON_ID=439317 /ORGANISM="Gambierdiscus australes, Strain CAWD 149" /LENGTH=38 /DNA_ID= /DNA_START= /DNA_END= /DNA_ORIENTATION=